jgi:uncharacterized protein involved in response to NO
MSSLPGSANWRVFAAAPHRYFFATGVFFMVLLSAWWFAVLTARAGFGAVLEPVVPGVFLHGAIMLYLVFPPFMFGFLLTVYPRWQPAPPIPAVIHALVLGLLHVGLLLLLAGFYLDLSILIAGWIAITLAWLVIVGGLGWSLWHCPAPVIHSKVVWLGLSAGLVGAMLFVAMLISQQYALWPWVVSLGLWGFLLTVFIGVCHRMIPFFTSRIVPTYQVWRPEWVLWLFVATACLRALLLELPAVQWFATLVLLVIGATFAWRWRPRQRHGNAMLAVLHISMAWLVIGVALQFVQDAAFTFLDVRWFGRAPLHALGMGFFGSMLLAMITRVTMGHSGRPLLLDRKGWLIFQLLQLATILRVVAEMVSFEQAWQFAIAAAVWTLAFATWAWRYGRMHFQPRADGQPG